MTNLDARSYRLTNIDFLRGLVVVLMAIDHSRDFFFTSGVQDPMADPNISAGVYFTRWITHFCAPVFVFLAGTSAGLMRTRKSKNELGGFLLKRGLWLIAVEVIIISNGWAFAPFGIEQLGGIFIALQVIWAIGGSMVVLAGAQYLGVRSCLWIGLTIIIGQHLLPGIWPVPIGDDPLWVSFYAQTFTLLGPFYIMVPYPIIPWIGVMLLGFGTAGIFTKAPEERDTFLKKAGLVMILAFLVLRSIDMYGDPNPWEQQPAGILATFFDFMNVSKYPPSLLFLLATLGPMSILCGYTDKLHGKLKDALVMFGRVPFIFYVGHIYLIHLMSIFYGMTQGFDASEFFTFFVFYPKGYGTGIPGVYIVWVLVLVILFLPCRWMYNLKRSRKDWWLSYI